MTKKTNINFPRTANPASSRSRHSLLKRNFINVKLLDIVLFAISPGLPIDSYFSGCLVSNILKRRLHRKNQTRTEQNSTPNIITKASFTSYSLSNITPCSAAAEPECLFGIKWRSHAKKARRFGCRLEQIVMRIFFMTKNAYIGNDLARQMLRQKPLVPIYPLEISFPLDTANQEKK